MPLWIICILYRQERSWTTSRGRSALQLLSAGSPSSGDCCLKKLLYALQDTPCSQTEHILVGRDCKMSAAWWQLAAWERKELCDSCDAVQVYGRQRGGAAARPHNQAVRDKRQPHGPDCAPGQEALGGEEGRRAAPLQWHVAAPVSAAGQSELSQQDAQVRIPTAALSFILQQRK